jgi:hypothetical protein
MVVAVVMPVVFCAKATEQSIKYTKISWWLQKSVLITIYINKLHTKLPLILLCTIMIDNGLFDCRVLPQQGRKQGG